MHVEHAQLSSALREVGFSSKTAFSGQFDASITRWEPRADDPDVSREVIAARDCAMAVESLGLRVVEVHRIELTNSTASFLTFTVVVMSEAYEVAGLMAVYDAMPPRLIPRANAAEAGPLLVFTLDADRSTSHARGAWVAILGTPKGTAIPAFSEVTSRQLAQVGSATLGRVMAPGSEPREAARPTRGKPRMRGPEGSPPPPPPMQAPSAPRSPPSSPPSRPPQAAPVSPPPRATTGAEPEAPPDRGRRTRGRRPPAGSEKSIDKRDVSGIVGDDRSEGRQNFETELDVTRRPEIEFHEVVLAREPNDLVLRLFDDITQEQLDEAFAFAIPSGKESITLSVAITAPGFEVEPRSQPITIGRSFDAAKEKATFVLTAQEPASKKPVKRDIRADIWLGNAAIGGVTHWTTVRPTAWKGPVEGAGQSRTVPFATSQSGRDCELVIIVQSIKDAGTPPYLVSLRRRIPDEPEVDSLPAGTIKFTRSQLATFLKDQFASFAKRYPADGNAAALKKWRADLLNEVDTLGKWLWTHLPEAFRAEYFRLHDAKHLPASILVQSDEMLIPWELVVPHRNGKVLPRLGVAHVMGRWRPALGKRPRPQALDITSATIANPTYQDAGFLIWSLLEAADLSKQVPAFRKMPSVDRAAMNTLLDRTDVQLLHFTGHGQYAKHADLSTLILENGETITAANFIGSKLLGVGHPIVYLNACEVGTSGVTMGQMGGFAAQCVEGGCSGIVAPYWAVADDSAREFAVAFYGQLKAGKAIGEALQALRKSKPKDPTYQAFAYLGDPWTQARFA